jgi:hypothetical protein
MRGLRIHQLLAPFDILPRMTRLALDEPPVAPIHLCPGLRRRTIGGRAIGGLLGWGAHPVPWSSWAVTAVARAVNSLMGAVPCSTILLDPITVLSE